MVILAVALGVPLLEAGPAGAAPTAPTLTAPASGATGAGNPTMMWNANLAADYYRVQISSDPGFASTIANVITYNTNYVHPEEFPVGTVYWRVLSHDSSGFSDPSESEVRTFIKTARDVPIPLDPPNNAVLTYPSDPVVVTWQTVPGASSTTSSSTTKRPSPRRSWATRTPTTTAPPSAPTWPWTPRLLAGSGEVPRTARRRSSHRLRSSR
ncbi:MAG: hypothetical protein R2690_16535 [Acidimicrobiales bacterium]